MIARLSVCFCIKIPRLAPRRAFRGYTDASTGKPQKENREITEYEEIPDSVITIIDGVKYQRKYRITYEAEFEVTAIVGSAVKVTVRYDSLSYGDDTEFVTAYLSFGNYTQPEYSEESSFVSIDNVGISAEQAVTAFSALGSYDNDLALVFDLYNNFWLDDEFYSTVAASRPYEYTVDKLVEIGDVISQTEELVRI